MLYGPGSHWPMLMLFLLFTGVGSAQQQPPTSAPPPAAASTVLPAPNGPFWVPLRGYGPNDPIIKGTYKRPDLVARPAN